MAIYFYNSLTRRKEEFFPISPGMVKLYTCGPTVYDTAHIGNFRAFLFEDLLKRYLLLKGFQVHHIMNITDVDDRTIKRSQENQITLGELTRHYEEVFFRDLETLKVLPADRYPRATEHIPEMIAMIQTLVDKGNAYVTEDGSVFFAITSYPEYGHLTRLSLDQQRTGERVAQDDYSKDNPQDFSLWKAWKPEDGDVSWDSPWGKGRPGWHIECSVMSMKYLGNHFDIHCGGVDNMFPHHENEIAQSVCATGEPFVNYWLHCEHLLVDGGKMSKSLGNFYNLGDLLPRGFTPETIRYILLATHYRSKVDFSFNKRRAAQRAVQRVVDLRDRLVTFVGDNETEESLPEAYDAFIAALDDDLDSPQALAVFYNWIRATNSRLDEGTLTPGEAQAGLQFIHRFNQVFDLIPKPPAVPPEIEALVDAREQARKVKDWVRADELRERIRQHGWVVEDTPTGPKCKPVTD
jgi:cysteinyl-tRNA synthetase